MPKITALEPQKRKGRLNVFVDGHFVIGVGEAVAVQLGLRIGREIDQERLRDIVAAEEVNKAYESALRSLDIRARSEREITQKLARVGFAETTVAAVVDKLRNMKLLDDTAFAAQWVEGRTRVEGSRPIGRRRLAQELFQKGVKKELAEEALANVSEDDEYILALAAAQKKVRKPPSDPEALVDEQRKLIAFLQRRGFGWGTIKRVIADVLGAGSEDIDDFDE